VQVARTSSLYRSFQYRGTLDALVTIVRREGVMALYRGSLASCLKISLSIGAMYGLYDLAKNTGAIEGIRECAPAPHHVTPVLPSYALPPRTT
jgi:hypothetical protein